MNDVHPLIEEILANIPESVKDFMSSFSEDTINFMHSKVKVFLGESELQVLLNNMPEVGAVCFPAKFNHLYGEFEWGSASFLDKGGNVIVPKSKELSIAVADVDNHLSDNVCVFGYNAVIRVSKDSVDVNLGILTDTGVPSVEFMLFLKDMLENAEFQECVNKNSVKPS